MHLDFTFYNDFELHVPNESLKLNPFFVRITRRCTVSDQTLMRSHSPGHFNNGQRVQLSLGVKSHDDRTSNHLENKVSNLRQTAHSQTPLCGLQQNEKDFDFIFFGL